MHISRLQLVNYRNFARVNVPFRKGINTVIGENGSGKTNLFRAMRLLLDDDMLRMAHRIDEGDFHRGLDDWRGHWIVISLEFEEVSQDEALQALFLHGTGNVDDEQIGRATYNLIFRPNTATRLRFSRLAEGDLDGLADLRRTITLDDYEVVFTGRSTADFSDPAQYRDLVGDFEAVRFPTELEPPEIGGRVPKILSVAKEISFTFVQALRDVVAEFQNNRTNPLLSLLRSKSGEVDPEALEPITELVNGLNAAIEELPDVGTIRGDIRQTIRDAAGETYSPAGMWIRSGVPAEAEKLFQSLRLFVGETDDGYEGAIHELSLGGANLIYLTLKLLHFRYQREKQVCANFLVIEEPEAHIHTHIQKTLFDRLSYPDTQVIYSTHSSHISEVSNVENVNVLSRVEGRCEAYQPAAGLPPDQVRGLQRYLDAVRSNLLFAKSVLLVEGDAEEILVPALVKEVLGVSLDELGISLINIGSTGFENVAVVFHEDRMRKRCAIVTDLDTAFFDTTPDPLDDEQTRRAKAKALGSQQAGLARQIRLDEFAAGNPWISVHYARHTFEVDFVEAGNHRPVVAALPDFYSQPATIALATSELQSGDISQFGRRVLTVAAGAGKGWFAIQVAKKIDADTELPDYIAQALFAAHSPSRPVVANILLHRIEHLESSGLENPETIVSMRGHVDRFRDEEITLADVLAEMVAAFPADQISRILNHAV
jgi:putative ATP-dependent endonuclease of the OLD family